ncbi:MAG: hypothetical protein HQ567_00410 [Candidatus Nealsonbacteria bacterium]|nr:hypothetical protein [Candidatus Nealsonbacteria bacterium]
MIPKDFNLNPGGIVGGLACAGGAMALMLLGETTLEIFGMLMSSGIVGGAMAGNFLWKTFRGDE